MKRFWVVLGLPFILTACNGYWDGDYNYTPRVGEIPAVIQYCDCSGPKVHSTVWGDQPYYEYAAQVTGVDQLEVTKTEALMRANAVQLSPGSHTIHIYVRTNRFEQMAFQYKLQAQPGAAYYIKLTSRETMPPVVQILNQQGQVLKGVTFNKLTYQYGTSLYVPEDYIGPIPNVFDSPTLR